MAHSGGMSDPADELAIRLRRADLNRALADADLAGIGAILAPQALLVTGTDSALLSGRKAQLQAWKREFAAPAAMRNLYVRTPDSVLISAVEPIATERGLWTCTVAGTVTAAGTYAAKWRKLGGAWAIEAELFTTLS